MRETVITAIISALGSIPQITRVSRREKFEEDFQISKEGKAALPNSWTPPFLVIDDQVAEKMTASNQLMRRARIELTDSIVVREWRQTDNVTYEPGIVICASTNSMEALIKAIERALPMIVRTPTITTLDGDVWFVATIGISGITPIATKAAWQSSAAIRDIRLRVRYGRMTTSDRFLKTLTGPVPKPEA